jgi:hypothetical protein
MAAPDYRHLLAQAGKGLAALVVFTSGWLAMRSEGWQGMVGWTAIGLVAALLAANATRRMG